MPTSNVFRVAVRSTVFAEARHDIHLESQNRQSEGEDRSFCKLWLGPSFLWDVHVLENYESADFIMRFGSVSMLLPGPSRSTLASTGAEFY